MLTQDKLKELLYYDPDTGIFKWKVSNSNSIKIGDIVRSKNSKGYIRVGIFGKRYFTHRLAWLYMYGEWPKEFIDHINRIKHDNRISNLREATRSENYMNTVKQINNTSGYKGVSWKKQYNKWVAQIRVDNKSIHLGYFDDVLDAATAYNIAASKYHGDFANY